MKIEDVMLSEEEEQFLPPTTVLKYYKDKTQTAVEVINYLTLTASALLAILLLFGMLTVL